MSQAIDRETFTPEVKNSIEELSESVKDLIGYPLSSWAVAATIESIGIRDIDAEADYGFPNVFELADHVYDKIRSELQEEAKDQKVEPFRKGFFEYILFFFKHYGGGLLLSLPMLVQVMAILIFEYALWAWLRFNETQATVVAFGTILAFVVTGGFIQVIGRMVSKYTGEENYYLAGKAIWRIIQIAIPTILLVAAIFFLINITFPFYPQSMLILALVYYFLISLLLLSASVLFATKLRVMIFVSITIGTAAVIVMMNSLSIGVYLAQWLSLLITVTMMSGYSYLFYRIRIRSLKQELTKQTLPKLEVNYYNNYRFFLYGFCYFLFLFVDRIMAWSAGPPPPPYIFWFNTPYELGMDWALISFVITISVLEFCIYAFSDYLIPAQKNTLIRDTKGFNKYFKRFYNWQLLMVLVIGIVSIIGTYFGVLSLRVFDDTVPEIKEFFANPMTFKVFWMASIGYFFLVYGLLNSLFFFTLNRPEYVIYSMLGSLFVNGIVGYLCSRWFGLEYATIGLIAGALVFAVSNWLIARKFFKHLDYYYYSAY